MSKKAEKREIPLAEVVAQSVEKEVRGRINKEGRPIREATRYLAKAINELTYGYEDTARKNIKYAVQVLDGKEVDC